MIDLPPELVTITWEFTLKFMARVRARDKGLSGTHGINDDPIRTAEGKGAEFIWALARGLDPAVVDTTIYEGRQADPGWDVTENGIRVAVRQTQWTYQYLYWPQGKNAQFARLEFHVMGLVKTKSVVENGRLIGLSGQPAGWLEKRAFDFRKKIAPDGIKPEERHHLTPGTWYVRQEHLHPMSEFEPGKRPHIRKGEPQAGPREHYCPICCQAASFGFTVGQETTFFCAAHRPEVVRPPSPPPPAPARAAPEPEPPPQGSLF